MLCALINLEDSSDPDLARIAAMQDHSPIQSLQFDRKGDLILANLSALKKYNTGGIPLSATPSYCNVLCNMCALCLQPQPGLGAIRGAIYEFLTISYPL